MKLWKIRWKLWALGEFYIPMLRFVKPRIIHYDSNEVRVFIRLRWRTKNHLKSMYFGALAVGADVTAGIHLFAMAEEQKKKISFAFKKAEMEFLKRAESDVTLICAEGEKLRQILVQADETKERINEKVLVEAFDRNEELVARFWMTVSIKVK